MNAFALLQEGWRWNPTVGAALIVGTALYVKLAGRRGRPGCFVAAVLLVALAFFSPLDLLARGILFSAHMTQHILLLLLVPGLLWLSSPTRAGVRSPAVRRNASNDPRPNLPPEGGTTHPSLPHPASRILGPLIPLAWLAGVGSMWLWHIPALCDAAALRPSIHTLQTLTLLGAGALFWAPILHPSAERRLNPGHGIAYLFTACLGCSALGILITISPVEMCPVFRGPAASQSPWWLVREQLTFHRDQQIGGLLMWVPMCLVYVGGIVLELARWLGAPRNPVAAATSSS